MTGMKQVTLRKGMTGLKKDDRGKQDLTK